MEHFQTGSRQGEMTYFIQCKNDYAVRYSTEADSDAVKTTGVDGYIQITGDPVLHWFLTNYMAGFK